MTIGKIVKRISFGFIFAILAIGVLPYLFAYSFSELFGISELTTAPLLLLQRIFKDGSGNHDIPNSNHRGIRQVYNELLHSQKGFSLF